MENRAFGALAAALLLCCAMAAPAAAEPLRVLYAEPFQAQTTSTPGVQKAGPANLRVNAFGRTFELELEDNNRLLRAASAQTRQRIGSVQLLKGTIKDVPGSWVRLTLSDGVYTGAFWDGTELYAIESREQLDAQLLVPMPAAATGIYRLSDTQGGAFQGTCAVEGTAPPSGNASAQFRALIGELRAAADSAFAAAATREIDISMVGDFEFTSRLGSTAVSTMVARMNVVDGIFSNQVGVTTTPTDFITFTSNTDPFTASEASALLNQFADYRNSTPVVRSRGLAHLLTGRELNGNTIGIAFLGSLCLAREGASLSESSSFIDSALVIAHELGHNFGAPHDAEPGSPCASEPASFIMAPELNFSSDFSTCSLQRMQPRIDAASCIVAARNRDLAVTVPSDELQALVGAPINYVVDVASVGDTTALNAVLTVQVPGGAFVSSASMPDATCSVQFGVVRCELQDLAPGQSRRLTLAAGIQTPGDFVFVNTVTSSNDVNSANNSRSVTVHVLRETLVGVAITPQPLTVTTGQPFELTYEISADGALPLNDMSAEISAGLMTATAASVDGGTCTLTDSGHRITCQLQTIAPGAARQIHVQWAGLEFARDTGGFVRTINPGNPGSDRFVSFDVHVLAARDVGIVEVTPPFQRTAIGRDAVWSLQVGSLGVNAVNDVHVQLSSAASEVIFAVDGPLAANCTLVGSVTDCALGAMASQTMRTLQFRTRADVALTTDVVARIVLPVPDNQPDNDVRPMFFDVRVGDEVAVTANVASSLHDERLAVLFAVVSAAGADASENVQLDVTLPAGFIAQSARFGDQACAIQSATPHLVSCSLARIESEHVAVLNLEFIAAQTGTFAGTVAVSADDDTDASNNTQALTFDVQPNVDGRLIGPPNPPLSRTDLPLDLTFMVNTNKYALPDASLTFSWFAPLSQFSANAPGATCASVPNGYRCQWTSLPANSSIPVAVRMQVGFSTSGSLQAFLGAATDVDGSNNSAFVSFAFVEPGDVGVSVTQTAVTATTGQTFDVPGIDIVTTAPLQSAFVRLTFDTTRLQFVQLTNGFCFGSQPLECHVSGMEVPGTRPLGLRVRPQGTGAVPIAIQVGAFNDFNESNALQTLTVTLVDPPPPPPPPPPPSPPPPPPPPSSGGGGGGSMSWLLAALLLAMWHHRRLRAHR